MMALCFRTVAIWAAGELLEEARARDRWWRPGQGGGSGDLGFLGHGPGRLGLRFFLCETTVSHLGSDIGNFSPPFVRFCPFPRGRVVPSGFVRVTAAPTWELQAEPVGRDERWCSERQRHLERVEARRVPKDTGGS